MNGSDAAGPVPGAYRPGTGTTARAVRKNGAAHDRTEEIR